MRNFFKVGCIILLTCLAACDKDNFEPDYSQGKATALKNGEFWIGQGYGYDNNQDIGIDMFYDVFDNLGQRRQRLSFTKIPNYPGVYNVLNTSSQSTDSLSGCNFATLSSDGDVIQDIYRVVESGNESTVTVLNYNESERLFCGEFRVKLYIDPDRPKTNPDNPDTIVFEMGEFEVKIEE